MLYSIFQTVLSYQNSTILQKLWILNICNAVLPQHFQIKELSISVYWSWTFFPPLYIFKHLYKIPHSVLFLSKTCIEGVFCGCKLQEKWLSIHNLLTVHQQCSDEFLGIHGNLYAPTFMNRLWWGCQLLVWPISCRTGVALLLCEIVRLCAGECDFNWTLGMDNKVVLSIEGLYVCL